MRPRAWSDLGARARGLGTRLLDRATLESLGRARDLPSLGRGLVDAGVAPEGTVDPRAMEAAVRRRAGVLLGTLARWSGDRARALTPMFDDADRASVRALVRGAAAGAPPDERLAAAIPTPALPERALRELAAQPTVAAVAALLALWGHPYGTALRDEAARANPDALRLDLALARAWAARATAAVAALPPLSAARRELRAHVRCTIDAENVLAALVLAGRDRPATPEHEGEEAAAFLEGGARLSRDAFLDVTRAPDVPTAARLLAVALGGTPLGAALAEHADAPLARIEDAVLAATVRAAAAESRRAPLGLAPVLAFALRVRAEARDLRRIVWRTALGAPPVAGPALVSAPGRAR